MKEASLLNELLIKLYQLSIGAEANPKMKASIRCLVESNGLERNEDVPTWLINFFQSILEGQSTEKLYITPENNSKSEEADVWNFLAELESVLEIKCEDSGEEIEMVFSTLGIYALISVESGLYQIQSADDQQCTSYAKEKLSKYKSP